MIIFFNGKELASMDFFLVMLQFPMCFWKSLLETRIIRVPTLTTTVINAFGGLWRFTPDSLHDLLIELVVGG
jgi:hypothetical protein